MDKKLASPHSEKPLDKRSIGILADIARITRWTGGGVDAQNYRAQHDDDLDGFCPDFTDT